MVVLAKPLVHRRELDGYPRGVAAEVSRLLHEHRANLERATLREIAPEREARDGIARPAPHGDVVERLGFEDAPRDQERVRARDEALVLRDERLRGERPRATNHE